MIVNIKNIQSFIYNPRYYITGNLYSILYCPVSSSYGCRASQLPMVSYKEAKFLSKHVGLVRSPPICLLRNLKNNVLK